MTDYTRTIVLDHTRAEGDTVPAVLSTDVPVDRGTYLEVLEHTETAVDLSRAPLPLIEGHDSSRVNVGIVENLRISGGKLRGLVRFGTTARARELLADVKAGIVRGLSIGYQISQTRNEGNTLIATRWSPFELSAVAVPADIGAGFYRSNDHMTTDTSVALTGDTAAAARAERERCSTITEMATRHNKRDLGDRAIAEGMPLDQFRGLLLDQVGQGPLNMGGVDLSSREQRQYSIVRAIALQLDPSRATREGGLEIEVSRELDRQAGRPARGIRVPMFTGQRDLTTAITTGTSKAGHMVGTDIGNLVDVLRSKMILEQLGVTRLTGLQGNVQLPRKTVSATSYWVAENSSPTEGALSFDYVSLVPKTCAAFVDFSRRFALQSSLDAEQLVRNDLMESMARTLDSAAIGSTVTNGPTGIRGTAGIGSVTHGTNGGPPLWSTIVNLIREVEIDNGAGAAMAFLTNDKVKAKLMATPRQSSGVEGAFIIGENPALLGGQKAVYSNGVPSNLTKGSSGAVCSAIYYGDWSQLVWALWGNAFDILVDPYTGSSAGTVRVCCFTETDFGVRHPESFAVTVDVTT